MVLIVKHETGIIWSISTYMQKKEKSTVKI
jgi:hypothetical protein